LTTPISQPPSQINLFPGAITTGAGKQEAVLRFTASLSSGLNFFASGSFNVLSGATAGASFAIAKAGTPLGGLSFTTVTTSRSFSIGGLGIPLLNGESVDFIVRSGAASDPLNRESLSPIFNTISYGDYFVPEPSAYILMATVTCILGCAVRRHRRRSSTPGKPGET
jgi:hypothetical protein